MIKKLLIAVPCYDVMRAEFVQSLLRLMSRLGREKVWFEVKIISGTVLDDDMVFEDNILEDLTISGKTDQIICGRFVSRHNPYLPTIFSRADAQWDRFDEDHIPEDTFRIAACGFACVLTPVQCLGDVLNNNGGFPADEELQRGPELLQAGDGPGLRDLVRTDGPRGPRRRGGHLAGRRKEDPRRDPGTGRKNTELMEGRRCLRK